MTTPIRLTSTTAAGIGALAYDGHGNTSTFGAETHVYDIADRHIETRAATPANVALIVANPDGHCRHRTVGSKPGCRQQARP
ncbi:MAG: hypothetical protein V9F03_10510 [Microthrixaceae bacterium]